MASTTKTTNLKLSQFVGTDKPAWLTDYNGDMQKIDDGYKNLKDANAATQADLDATKQDLSGSQTDITDVKASVQALEAQDIAIGNRLVVLEGNYDTMHHEVAANEAAINTNADNISGINDKLNAKKAIGGIKYDMGIGDKVASVEIRRSGSNNQDLSIIPTTASGITKHCKLYDYDTNTILPNFYSKLVYNWVETESYTLAAGESKTITLPIAADIICVTDVTCRNADVRCYDFILANTQTASATITFSIKNYGSSSWTGTVRYSGLKVSQKGVLVE